VNGPQNDALKRTRRPRGARAARQGRRVRLRAPGALPPNAVFARLPRHSRAACSAVLFLVFGAASSVHAYDWRACTADTYAAVFAPWTDQNTAPQLFLIPEGAEPVALPVAEPNVTGLICTADGVRLRSKAGVASVAVSTAPAAVSFDARAPWFTTRQLKRRAFTLSKPRVVSFGANARRQLIVARATGGSDSEPQVFTAVVVADMPPQTLRPRLLFSTNMLTITVD